MRHLLDTVTVSELRRGPRVDPNVKRWQEGIGEVWISVITLNELRFGIRMVETKDPPFAARLLIWYSQLLSNPQRFRILNVDRAIAEQAADYRADHRTPFEDSLIAATAKIHGLTLATRNTSHFEKTGIALVNPWDAGKV